MKKKIKKNGFVLGTWCEVPASYSANIIAKAGMDFIIIDMEHSVMGFDTAQEMVLGAQAEKCSAFIRVPKLDESYILRALDTGADGIVVPHVETMEDIKKITNFSKFHPLGERGFNPFIRSGNYGNTGTGYFAKENERTMTAVILEGIEAFNNIDELAADKNTDIYYIGQYDLSAVLGCPGDIANKKVTDFLKKAVNTINRHGKIAGCMVHNIKDAKEMLKIGVKFIVYVVDAGIISKNYRLFADGMKKAR